MSEIVIRAHNVGKKYIIGHEADNGRYRSLRDVLMQNARGVLRKTRDLMQGRAVIAGSAFEEVWALREVSFDVRRGEAIGLIGRNGTGKSTLLKILSRITEPTTGRVMLSGRVASLLEVGTGFHPELTGRENVYLNGAILGMSRQEIKRKFDAIVAFAEVERFLDTPVKRYSSGMYVRLAFAVAAHLEPDILVVDEVLAVGDAAFQRKCLGKMDEVARSGRTVFYVSHNMPSIRKFCSRVIMLSQGQIVADGSPEKIVNQYLAEGEAENTHVVEWADADAAPQNPSARIRRISIQYENGDVVDQIDVDTSFDISVEYSVVTPNASVGFTVIFNDSDGNCIFSSLSNREPVWYSKRMPRGDYVTTCRIPGGFLNDTMYNLTINMYTFGYSHVVSVPDVLRIKVLDASGLSGDYQAGFGGVLRPTLSWRTNETPNRKVDARLLVR